MGDRSTIYGHTTTALHEEGRQRRVTFSSVFIALDLCSRRSTLSKNLRATGEFDVHFGSITKPRFVYLLSESPHRCPRGRPGASDPDSEVRRRLNNNAHPRFTLWFLQTLRCKIMCINTLKQESMGTHMSQTFSHVLAATKRETAAHCNRINDDRIEASSEQFHDHVDLARALPPFTQHIPRPLADHALKAPCHTVPATCTAAQ